MRYAPTTLPAARTVPIQLVLVLRSLPGPDWPTQPLYAEGKSCPVLIEDAGQP